MLGGLFRDSLERSLLCLAYNHAIKLVITVGIIKEGSSTQTFQENTPIDVYPRTHRHPTIGRIRTRDDLRIYYSSKM